jgi:4-alpha-glucanotransferase
MNVPATLGGNWRWRFREEALRPEQARRLLQLARMYGRSE